MTNLPQGTKTAAESLSTHESTPTNGTTLFTLKLTARELTLLASLAEDQLFRREFIDPKMPGHRPNPGETSMGKALVERLRQTLDPERARKAAAAKARGK